VGHPTGASNGCAALRDGVLITEESKVALAAGRAAAAAANGERAVPVAGRVVNAVFGAFKIGDKTKLGIQGFKMFLKTDAIEKVVLSTIQKATIFVLPTIELVIGLSDLAITIIYLVLDNIDW
jgi:hypothetical protein